MIKLETIAKRAPLPSWLKSKIPIGDNYTALKTELKSKGLYTVCQEAKCPNLGECWENKTATVMILGDTCTRACKFCHVKTGNPKGFINHQEIENTAEIVKQMNLKYVVITSVDRDDLPDGGSQHFADVVKRVREVNPQTQVEILIPDFSGNKSDMQKVATSGALVVAQNLETVKRLTHVVRDRRAGYEQTLNCLRFYHENYPQLKTKTSLMVGLGETMSELYETMQDIKAAKVNVLTLGQYLRPSTKHLKVEKIYTPDEFAELKRMAQKIGFDFVAAGPMVRSSYKAADFLDHLQLV